MTRQIRRARFREAAAAALKSVLPGCPRRIRRLGSRAYANQAYRELTEQEHPLVRHRYRRLFINRQILDWVLIQGR